MRANEKPWWDSDKGKVNKNVLEHAKRLESDQGDMFDRFVKLEALYDPHTPNGNAEGGDPSRVTENVVASNVDTATAGIASTVVRARIMTDGADWAQQRIARHQEWYAEELQTLLDVHPKCRAGFKECVKKGTGITETETVFGEIQVNHVLIDNVIVPPGAARSVKPPREMHIWEEVDVDELCARFPKADAKIRASFKSRRRYRPRSGSLIDYEIEVLKSWRLPVGRRGLPGYKAGRRSITIDGHDLLDEPYHKTHFPTAVIVWSERTTSFYGISGGERIAGIQRALNRRNWQIEKQLDQAAQPTTYVRPSDAGLAAKSHKVGTIAVCKGDYPHTVTPPAVAPETMQSRIDLRDAAGHEFGQSPMATHAAKPAGLDSGVALREYRDAASQRYAIQEQDFEQFVLDTVWLILDSCKDLGAKSPVVSRRSRFGKRRIKWSDVDMRDVRVQLKAASNLNRTPAGRTQFVLELAQAGIISQDSARRLLTHPDIERELSLYTAALESIEHALDEIADGRIVMPEPFMNLAMCVWRGQQEYLKWVVDGAPEDILESLRQFVVQAAYMVAMKDSAAQNANMPAADPTAAMLPDAGMPALPPGPPAGAPPMSALAPTAMQLRAS